MISFSLVLLIFIVKSTYCRFQVLCHPWGGLSLKVTISLQDGLKRHSTKFYQRQELFHKYFHFEKKFPTNLLKSFPNEVCISIFTISQN